nr:hypothetical protein [uncultured Cohaesibacter sp.]
MAASIHGGLSHQDALKTAVATSAKACLASAARTAIL